MPAIIARVASVIRNLTRRSRIEHDLDEELRATVEMLAAENVRAGHTPDAARRAALVELGGIETIKEGVRDVRSGAMLDTLAQDVRYGVRLLRRYPLFAMTAALSLAIGIGANTAVFTIGNSLLRFSPVAVSEPERLVDIGRSFDGLPIGFNPASYPDYLDIRRRTTTLDHVYAHPLFPKDMTVESEASTEKAVGEVVTTNYFASLGTRAEIGRLFLPDESDAQGSSPLVVLSHRFWVRSFNADPRVVGQTVRLNRYPVTVVGVAPEGFQGTTVVAVDLWVPMSLVTFVTGSTPGGLEDRRAGWVVMGARLKPGASIEQATADVAGIDRALRSEYPNQSHPQPFRLLPASPMADKMPLAAAALLLLGAIASTVLVIACANVAGLLLARASGRGREMALRLAVGANRSRLIRQLLTETLLLFAIGAVAGIALARAMTTGLMSLLPALPVPVHLSLALDWRVVALACSLAFVAALLSGLAPALHASRADVSTVLKDEGHGASARLRMRSAFVVAQVSLSLVLVFVGGLFTRALQQASSTNAGFDARGVEVASIDELLGRDGDAPVPALRANCSIASVTSPESRRHPCRACFRSPTKRWAWACRCLVRCLGLVHLRKPQAAATSSRRAISPRCGFRYAPGATSPTRTLQARHWWLSSVRLPLVDSGRARIRSGRQLIVNGGSRPGASIRVVGVAHDVRYRALDFGTVPYVYLPLGQHDTSNLSLIVRSADGRSVAARRASRHRGHCARHRRRSPCSRSMTSSPSH